ncbi:MAG TPA: hypothetical protein PKC28_04375 [Bdellovibrionales bacterium]|nr:hypothetical protein [Bdellovibrionales bacterium]
MDVVRNLKVALELDLNTQKLESASTVEKTVVETALPRVRVETRDVLQQLNSNIQLLEDLGGRLSFMLTEVRSLIRR